MTHLEDERIQRLLHGELRDPERSAVQAHLSGCDGCRQAVSAAERENDELRSLLRQVDHRPPAIVVNAIIARSRRRGLAWRRLAAGVLLSVGLASAAYAAPGSPLPGWLAAAGRFLSGTAASTLPVVPELPAPAPELAGIAITPGARLTILFSATQRTGAAHVSLIDGPDVVVRVPGGAAAFTSEANRLVIDNRGSSASFQIEIPRAAPRVEIMLGATRLFLKEGARITVDAASGAPDSYSLPLNGSAP
ncbi:MAG: zf-HC2 domain-containing protein [Gemmatimonadota bacterium]|nr:zf-HC2 domain-containing protein [Gemmatimonadota bacterium]